MRTCRKCEHYIVHNDNASGDWIYENGGDTYGAISTKDFSKLSLVVNVMHEELSKIKAQMVINLAREAYVENNILYIV